MAALTVIVVNWNGEQLLPECLTSLSNQSLSDVEVLLVDNGSTDDSISLVRSLFPKVKILALRENHGFAGGNNRGIQASIGEFVALLNNDAVADYCWAERLLAAACDSRVGIVASRVLLYSDRGRLDSAGDGMTTVGAGYKRGHLMPSNSYPSAEDVFGASGCAMLLRRSMLADVGRFDEDFFLLAEDSDLCFRAQLRGWRCLYAPDAIVYHKLNASIGKLSRAHVFYGQRNVEYLYFKNMPGWLVWKYLPVHLLNALLASVYFGRKGHFSSYMESKLDFLRNMRRVLQKRQEIQAQRTVSCRNINRMLDRRWLRTRLPGK
jgi:GT2 family glycosyltransferase